MLAQYRTTLVPYTQAQYRTPPSTIRYLSTAQPVVPYALAQYRTSPSTICYLSTAHHLAPYASSVPHSPSTIC
eukprot:1712434-Rhodomonas_salina.1